MRVGWFEIVDIERKELILGVVGTDCLIEVANEVEADLDRVVGELVSGESFVEMERSLFDVEGNIDILLLAVVVIGHDMIIPLFKDPPSAQPNKPFASPSFLVKLGNDRVELLESDGLVGGGLSTDVDGV